MQISHALVRGWPLSVHDFHTIISLSCTPNYKHSPAGLQIVGYSELKLSLTVGWLINSASLSEL